MKGKETVTEVRNRIEEKIKKYEGMESSNKFTNDKTLIFELLEGVKKKMNNDALFFKNITTIEYNIRQELGRHYGLSSF